MSIHSAEFLKNALSNNGLIISSAIQEQLLHYLDLMREWNRVFNLTSICEPNDMIMLHLLDSLVISPYLHGTRLIDVGSGAGLPGIPLALIEPNKLFVLVDSNHKKTRFLTHVIHELNIKNVEVIHQRAETSYSFLEKKAPNNTFDSILSRGFASLHVMLERTKQLVSEHGQFLAMKGVYPEKELHDIPDTFRLLAVHKLTIKGLDAERHLVCMEKVH